MRSLLLLALSNKFPQTRELAVKHLFRRARRLVELISLTLFKLTWHLLMTIIVIPLQLIR